jgi:hypothetical protein
MPAVKFLKDFRGVASAEQYYTAGTVVDLPEWQAKMLQAEGAATLVSAPALETGAGGAESSTPAPAVKSTAKMGRKPRAKKAAA